MGRLLVVGCVVMASLGVTSADAASRGTQTCRAKALALTFTLPSDWLCQIGGAPPKPRYGGVAPGGPVLLYVYTDNAAPNKPISWYAPRLIALVKQGYAHSGTNLAVTSTSTNVGNALPAVRVTASYDGIWLEGAGQRGRITHVMYFFVRGGRLYEFDYHGVSPWVIKDLPVFTASAKSIRFLNAA